MGLPSLRSGQINVSIFGPMHLVTHLTSPLLQVLTESDYSVFVFKSRRNMSSSGIPVVTPVSHHKQLQDGSESVHDETEGAAGATGVGKRQGNVGAGYIPCEGWSPHTQILTNRVLSKPFQVAGADHTGSGEREG